MTPEERAARHRERTLPQRFRYRDKRDPDSWYYGAVFPANRSFVDKQWVAVIGTGSGGVSQFPTDNPTATCIAILQLAAFEWIDNDYAFDVPNFGETADG